MKQSRIILLFFLVMQAVDAAESLYGLELAAPSLREQHRVHFVSLFRQYCVDSKSQAMAMQSLVNNRKFQATEEHEGVFEQYYAGISYAIAPDTESCTVDVMLALDGNRLLFTQNELIEEIGKIPGYRLYQSIEATESGIKADTVKVIKTTFTQNDSSENRLELVYPVEHQDEYFMTLSYYYKDSREK